MSRLAFHILIPILLNPFLSALAIPLAPPETIIQTDSLPSDRFFKLYGNLDNFFHRVGVEKKACVAFLGGSITAGGGWRDMVMQYFEEEYPSTEWTFINAGIPSLGSVPHAFRLDEDVLAKGRVDLLFVESAVNDLANGTPLASQRRALEGIVRHALTANPSMNIVVMAFVDEPKIDDYTSGKTPQEVAVHDEIARHYQLPFINLAKEVSERIQARELTWEEDFVDLHPSPFGHKIYARTITRMLEKCAPPQLPARLRQVKLPGPIDKANYDKGTYVSVGEATRLTGFHVDPSWVPKDNTATRKGFVNVPMLVAEGAGSSFEFSFSGTAVGIAVISGPDAGSLSYSVDGGAEKTVDLYTEWSHLLHLPWYVILGDELEAGEHSLKVTLSASANSRATGTACRVVHFLVNQ